MLIVEDERRLAVSLAKGLRAEGFAVDVTHDGKEGLHLANEVPYDLILLDVSLPGMNGYHLCEALRRSGDDVPILMLTAKDGEYDEAEGLDTGADDYLTKPFSYMVLLARIRALLRRAGQSASPVVRAGNLIIDRGTRKVRLGADEVPLTVKQFSVLEQLMLRPGNVVSKTEIMEHVWDFSYDGDPNIVEVYVSGLRRKLGAGVIETVRGAGYRVITDA